MSTKSKSNPWITNTDSFIDKSGHLVTIRDDGTRSVTLDFKNDPGVTEQSHKDNCDITYILNQYIRSGVSPQIPESVFKDLTLLPDYQTCLNTVSQIDSLFKDLPLAVRQAYDFNPAAFMDAVEDPTQRDTLTKLGVFNAIEGVPEGDLPPPVTTPTA